MDTSNAFGHGNYMNAANAIVGFELTIATETMKEMKDGRKKPVIGFKETEKELVINKSKAQQLTEVLGKGSWIDAKIQLGVTKVMFQGRMVDSIYIMKATPAAAVASAPVPAPAPAPHTSLLDLIKQAGKNGIHVESIKIAAKLALNMSTPQLDSEIQRLKNEGYIIENPAFNFVAV